MFGDTAPTCSKPATRLTGHLSGCDPATAPAFEWPERLKTDKVAHDPPKNRPNDEVPAGPKAAAPKTGAAASWRGPSRRVWQACSPGFQPVKNPHPAA